ncbi:hypothetical protein [Kocuria oceani]|uniref:Uncharacterized protein n=1 Tax=Kocuria oceani TaxID=988827 RepID=A0ABV9TLZ2_9MICC|nr:hypothetical protein [Kocuria oceani]
MADLFDFNHGGATHPGARAVVHPVADRRRHTVRYRVITETDEHIILDDCYPYDKRTGTMCGPAGRPTRHNRRVATEGSAMFASRSTAARGPDRQHAKAGPAYGRAQIPERAATDLRRLLQRG